MLEDFSISESVELVTSKLESWATTFIEMLPNFVIACLVVVAFWLVARLVRSTGKKLLSKFTDNASLVRLSGTILYVAVIAIGTFVALSILHLDKAVTSLLAGVGVVGLALGFAFQDIASNFVAGVLIATRKPYSIGDHIETSGNEGIVQEMNLRSTRIRTFRGQDVIIPNKQIFQNALTNYTLYPKRRIDLDVGVSYGDNLEKAQRVAKTAIENLDLLDQSKEVTVFYNSFADSSINFTVRYWVDEHKQSKYLKGLSDGVIAIKQAFEREDISIPFPIRTLDFGIRGGKGLSNTQLHILNENNN
ncbi:mechanosensitive ion channel family protein [Sanyastnella coralliicola]|uniref:mechanosensitive ion channel family protein n=1 Tax=Sanyastnella coralliicola TaxID=3069118 RepID=UPI0027BA0D82|nr:mechanosensitive ion channel family protein [Longitalea sp. SCSIO 12813]